jgi:gas vesicle protein
MLNERLAVSKPIAQTLKSVEQSLNDTMRQMGTLLVNIADAKSAKGTHFSLDLGIAASEKVAMAAVSAIQSYQQVVDAHHQLAEDRNSLNLPAKAFGDFYSHSSNEMPTPGLRAVGA